MKRGEIFRLAPPARGDPRKSRCYVAVSRQTLLDSRAANVVCAPINTTYDGLDTQVPVGPDVGLKHDSCINCDQLVLIEKSRLTNYVGSLPASKVRALARALRIALDLE
ncbi:MAG: type II toxin-antitoxin system PemK/MazF family toxin [Gemmatimonadetes bacterium]|nr:type II toxin-antitoxin system PemK/MazF family toxin [Gemmatimonadota bacterium]